MRLSPKTAIGLCLLWQAVALTFVVLGSWPASVSWISLGLLSAAVLYLGPLEGACLVLASLPFFVVLPQPWSEQLSLWRPVVAVLFLRWLYRVRQGEGGLLGAFRSVPWQTWDRWLAALGALAVVVSLLFSHSLSGSVRELAFLLNAYLLYVVLASSIESSDDLVTVLRWACVGLTVVVLIGFVQLAYSLAVGLDTFWVFWAANVSKPFYGDTFVRVALYSNSWFSFVGGRSLRMFSIMPDSQSFAYLCVFALSFGTALTVASGSRLRQMLWSGIRFAGLAAMLAGTRAVWVGMLAPLLASLGLLRHPQLRAHARRFTWTFAMVIVLFLASPLVNRGLDLVRFGGGYEENFFGRAKSIYDLSEPSNVGRIKIWGESLRYWLARPFGTGLANYRTSLSPAAVARYNLPERYISAHSLYLHVLVELGFLGLLGLLGAIGSFLLAAARYLRDHARGSLGTLYVLAAFVAASWLAAAAVFDITALNDRALLLLATTAAATAAVVSGRVSEGGHG